MKKKKLKKKIIIGIIIVVIIIIIGIVTTLVSSVSKREAQNTDNSYKNSYQYKAERAKNMQILKEFYGDYIVTEVSGTSPAIQLDGNTLKALENNMIGTQVNIAENQFSIKYHATDAINGNSFTNETVDNPYYEVNQTNENMFQAVYKTELTKVGISSASPYFINIGDKNQYEQEIIQDGNGGLLIYSQGVFFKLEAASKIIAKQNAQLENLANDALKVATGNTFKYVFPVEQMLVGGKFEYKNIPSSALFMCKTKDNSLVPDKDTMFITLTKGVVQPVENKAKDSKDNKDKNNKDQHPNPNAGKPFYQFSISTAAMMDQTKPNKPTVGKVYEDGAVEITK